MGADAAQALLPAWLHPAYDSVTTMCDRDRLPHALLIVAPLGWCEHRLISVLASEILGLPPAIDLQARAHHDLTWVEREEGKSGYAVEHIRGLIEFMQRTARGGNGNKVVVLPDAHRMRDEAANTLLKILEEPPPGGHWLLLTHEPGRLLPTIRSRCQQVTVAPPPDTDTRACLDELLASAADSGGATDRQPTPAQLAMLAVEFDGAPELIAGAVLAEEEPIWPLLAAVVDDKQHITGVAERWAERELGELLAVWQRYVHALLASSLPDYATQAIKSWTLVGEPRQSQPLFRFADELADARSTVMYNPGINKRLVLERLLLRWATAVS